MNPLHHLTEVQEDDSFSKPHIKDDGGAFMKLSLHGSGVQVMSHNHHLNLSLSLSLRPPASCSPRLTVEEHFNLFLYNTKSQQQLPQGA